MEKITQQNASHAPVAQTASSYHEIVVRTTKLNALDVRTAVKGNGRHRHADLTLKQYAQIVLTVVKLE